MSEDFLGPHIGPHEGKEFALLDSGQKHVAFFHDLVPDAYYEFRDRDEYETIEIPQTVMIDDREVIIPYRILFRKSHRQDAEKFAAILRQGYDDYFNQGEAIERENGRILSYPQPAIEYYINRLRSRGRIA